MQHRSDTLYKSSIFSLRTSILLWRMWTCKLMLYVIFREKFSEIFAKILAAPITPDLLNFVSWLSSNDMTEVFETI